MTKVATSGLITDHHMGSMKHFPLGQVLEDLALTLTLRIVNLPTQQQLQPQQQQQLQQQQTVYLSSWIITIQFMQSCLRNNTSQQLYNAGVTTPVILGIIKHILMELTRLPSNNLSKLQQSCYDVSKELLDLFLVRPENYNVTSANTSLYTGFYSSTIPPSTNLSLPINSITTSTTGISSISYYDVIYSVIN